MLFQRKKTFVEQFLHEVKINKKFAKLQLFMQETMVNDEFILKRLSELAEPDMKERRAAPDPMNLKSRFMRSSTLQPVEDRIPLDEDSDQVQEDGALNIIKGLGAALLP